MSHIEFFGPPGAGKSTLLSELITFEDCYGGTKDDAVIRYLSQKHGKKYTYPFLLSPHKLRKLIYKELLEYRLGPSALEDFICSYPSYIESVSNAMNSVSYEPKKVFSFCWRSAERYQLGISTTEQQETLCLDESFVQRAFAILWRDPDESFSLVDYLDSVPIPDLVVNVHAPTEVCLQRQRERGRLTITKDWESEDHIYVQKNLESICEDILDIVSNKTDIMTVNNTGTISEKVDEIKNRCEQA